MGKLTTLHSLVSVIFRAYKNTHKAYCNSVGELFQAEETKRAVVKVCIVCIEDTQEQLSMSQLL